MAKSKKIEEPALPSVEIEQPKFTYVPDIPAQMLEDKISATVEPSILSVSVTEGKNVMKYYFFAGY